MNDRAARSPRIIARHLSRRRLLVAGAAAALTSAVSCGHGAVRVGVPGQSGAEGAETPQYGGTLELQQPAAALSLDPHRSTSYYTRIVAGAALSRLLRFKTGLDPRVAEDREVEGDLALSAESPDAMTWTVKLRPDARFQNVTPVNGRAVQAEDVRTTFLRALDPESSGRAGLDMVDPGQIQTPNSDTVIFRLRYPYASFQATLASPNYSWILPREATDGSFDPAKHLIGSGPFMLESNQSDAALMLRRNPDWFEKGRPYVDAIRLSPLPDIGRVKSEFVAGRLDLVCPLLGSALSGQDAASLQRESPRASVVKVESGPGGTVLFVRLSDPTSAFQDLRVRRALSMAIDREAITKAVFDGDAERQFHVYNSLGKWALRQADLPPETAQYYKYDPAGARKLLADAGLTERQFKLLYIAGYGGGSYEQVSQTIASMLSIVGIRATPTGVDYQKDYLAVGTGIRYGGYDKDSIVSNSPAAYDCVDEFIFNYYDSKSTIGLSRPRDSDLDTRIAKARSTLKESDRVKVYIELQKYLADRMYSISGLPAPYVYAVAGARVRSYQVALGYGLVTESLTKLWLKPA